MRLKNRQRLCGADVIHWSDCITMSEPEESSQPPEGTAKTPERLHQPPLTPERREMLDSEFREVITGYWKFHKPYFDNLTPALKRIAEEGGDAMLERVRKYGPKTWAGWKTLTQTITMSMGNYSTLGSKNIVSEIEDYMGGLESIATNRPITNDQRVALEKNTTVAYMSRFVEAFLNALHPDPRITARSPMDIIGAYDAVYIHNDEINRRYFLGLETIKQSAPSEAEYIAYTMSKNYIPMLVAAYANPSTRDNALLAYERIDGIGKLLAASHDRWLAHHAVRRHEQIAFYKDHTTLQRE